MSVTVDIVAQSFPDMTLDKDFAAQVKSVDEFIQRFNGDELHPELKREDRMFNILALFDYEMNHEGLSDSAFKKKVMDFVYQVNADGAKIKLTDDAFYAEADITVNISGKQTSLSIFLQSQTYNKDRIRWAIVGVHGLTQAGIIDTEHFYGISPVDHETHFMSIGDIFAHNVPEIIGYRGKDTKIDELSVFLTMAKLDKIRIVNVNELTMHCLEIPNYVFTINEKGRRGRNSGWLISKIIKINENEKNEYKSKLLGR